MSISTLLGKPSRFSVTISPKRGPSLAELLRSEDEAPAPPPTSAAAPARAALPAATPPIPEKSVPAFVIGVDDTGADFLWSPSLQINPHLAILGASGTGKTELLRVLAHEFSLQELPTIAIDLHGELTFPRLRRFVVGAKAGLDPVALAVEAGGTARRETVLREVLGGTMRALGSVQDAALDEIIASQGAQLRSLGDLQRAVRQKAETVPNLRTVASHLEQLGRELSGSPLRLAELLRSGGVVDLHELTPAARAIAARALLSALWALVRSLPPTRPGALRVAVLIDEAALLQNLPALETLPREARKFGLSLTVATQLADDLPRGLASNVASLAVFRASDSIAARQAAKLLPGVTAARIADLPAPGWTLFRGRNSVDLVRVRPVGERRASRAPSKKL